VLHRRKVGGGKLVAESRYALFRRSFSGVAWRPWALLSNAVGVLPHRIFYAFWNIFPHFRR